MPPRSFDTLLELVAPRITKANTRLRKAIPPDHRLALAVRFLAAGETLRSSSFNFLAGRSTACMIIAEVCQAIWDILGPLYVKCPSSAVQWLKVSNISKQLDCANIQILCYSIKSLLAISDASYRFLYVEIGHFGSESDGGVFARSKFQELIVANQLGIPEDSEMGSIGMMPYFFVGDEAFPLKTFMMRPYSRKTLQPLLVTTADSNQSFEEKHQRRIFNYRLSRARRVVENAFGIMAQRWRILRRPFKAKDDNVNRIVCACVTLHNFLLHESPASRAAYCPPGTADCEDWQGQVTEGSWRAEEGSRDALSTLRATGFNSTSSLQLRAIQPRALVLEPVATTTRSGPVQHGSRARHAQEHQRQQPENTLSSSTALVSDSYAPLATDVLQSHVQHGLGAQLVRRSQPTCGDHT
ncbi:hypothetical protein HPB49_006933 [Dermacentor silvarum]|uniref:Uncharacterized protein n=1 Tax=Dermacentor silvarum TaxID=543639 RepID=A0ACB8CQH0_DERSI|nr:hypothetical protein HPB49_006933 [Dermacentor silvarum]